jgi:hypothetical protein
MRFQAVTIRFAALMVLLTSASDYSAFDRFDPSAPMNSAGLEAIRYIVSQTATLARVRTNDLPDDHCLFCSPWIAPRQAVLAQSSLSSALTQSPKVVLPSSQPIRIERPPRPA